MAYDGMTEAGPAGLSRPGVAAMLVGRDRELGLIASFLDQATAEGAALLFSGEPGVGKTVLLDAAADAAAAAGIQVLRAAGEEFESEAKFSGLSRLLHPVLGGLRQLSDSYQHALSVALGLSHGVPSDRLVVSNAVLALLRQARVARPVLVVVDDVHWLDRSSAVTLGLVTRRLAGSRIGFLAAARSGEGGFFERSGLPGREIRPLDGEAAARLVEARFPELAARVRQRVLAEAQGNPLALLELPAALSGPQRSATQGLPTLLPVNRRLRVLFASQVSDLPESARRLLLLAALDGSGDLRVLRAAGKGGLSDLSPAEQARLVRVDPDTGRLAFRHPLIRSAVVGLAPGDDRREAHRVLAEQLADQPERRAWHLGEAAVEPDEQVAGLLEEVAQRILRRADAVGAVSAAHVAVVREADIRAISPRLALITAAAAAIVAPDAQAAARFEEALSVPDVDQWPFDLARVQLLYGEWLRRARSTAEARAHLSAALDAFRRLGAQPWQVRAGNELRATGLAARNAEPGSPEPLAPLDRDIARLAAAGLTNKQIGERLYISHRTVAAHLYQLFPRLGITSRAALRDALDALEAPDPGDQTSAIQLP